MPENREMAIADYFAWLGAMTGRKPKAFILPTDQT
jgi:hypothetical protein